MKHGNFTPVTKHLETFQQGGMKNERKTNLLPENIMPIERSIKN